MKFDDNKKNILLLLLGALTIVLFLGGIFVENSKSDIAKFKEEYEEYNGKSVGEKKYFDLDIAMNNKINYINGEDLLNAMDSETAVFYFGFPTCPWCRNMINPLLNATKKEQVKLYYFNPRADGTDDDLYNKVIKKLDKYLEKDDAGNKVLYVPDVYFIKNGKVVGHHLGSLDTQKDPLTELSSKEKEKLENIYLDLIKKMK